MKNQASRAFAARPRAAQSEEPAVVPAEPEEIECELLDAPLDLNLASVADLRGLPGIGPTLAARIVEARAEHGPFLCVADLGTIQGITPKLLAKLSKRVMVGPASLRGSLVPWRGDGIVMHPSRVTRRAPVTRGPWLLPPPSTTDPIEVELEDDELVEVGPDHAPANDAPSSHVRVRAEAPRAQQPIVIEELAEPATPRWKRLAGVIALASAAAVAGLVAFSSYGRGYARQTDVEGLATEVRELQADRQQVRGRLARIEPVSEELPRTAAQVEALNAMLQAQQKDSAEALVQAQATVKRLKREVGILRDAIHHEQKKSDRILGGQAQSDARAPRRFDDDAGRNALAARP